MDFCTICRVYDHDIELGELKLEKNLESEDFLNILVQLQKHYINCTAIVFDDLAIISTVTKQVNFNQLENNSKIQINNLEIMLSGTEYDFCFINFVVALCKLNKVTTLKISGWNESIYNRHHYYLSTLEEFVNDVRLYVKFIEVYLFTKDIIPNSLLNIIQKLTQSCDKITLKTNYQ